MPPIVFNGVSLYFNNRAALDDVTLEFQRGKTTAVIGSSGSGKSLVLKCAAGLI
ncbi:MAG: ABC transporter ATP-binding protein, partial [Spirochaetes bacterium]